MIKCTSWTSEIRLEFVGQGCVLLRNAEAEALQSRQVRQAARCALLLGTHMRCGHRSLLKALPREALELILNEFAPAKPCFALGVDPFGST